MGACGWGGGIASRDPPPAVPRETGAGPLAVHSRELEPAPSPPPQAARAPRAALSVAAVSWSPGCCLPPALFLLLLRVIPGSGLWSSPSSHSSPPSAPSSARSLTVAPSRLVSVAPGSHAAESGPRARGDDSAGPGLTQPPPSSGAGRGSSDPACGSLTPGTPLVTCVQSASGSSHPFNTPLRCPCPRLGGDDDDGDDGLSPARGG